jgi:hypothetical protein
MLLTVPVEIQSHILAFLPRRDLAVALCVSHHVYELAIKLLYKYVVLNSIKQVQAFFLIIPASGRESAARMSRAEAKILEWEHIKTLDIGLVLAKPKPAFGNLPRCLRGPRSDAIQLDRLRLTSDHLEDLTFLSPLLRCFQPSTFALRLGSSRFIDRGPTLQFPSAASVSLVLLGMQCSAINVSMIATLLVRACPKANELELVCWKGIMSEAQSAVQMDIAGKPASFFSIKAFPPGSNYWGEVDEHT